MTRLRALFQSLQSVEVGRFLLVGSTAAAVNFSTRIIFRVLLSFPAAVAVGFSAGALVSFFLNRSYTFRSKDQSAIWQAVKFALTAAASTALAATAAHGIMYCYHELGAPLISESIMESIAHLAVIGLVMVFNFTMMKFFCFRR